jgi:hypothetical protein
LAGMGVSGLLAVAVIGESPSSCDLFGAGLRNPHFMHTNSRISSSGI